MNINRNLRIIDVVVFTSRILSVKNAEKYDSDTFTLKLLDNGREVVYDALVVFKKSEKADVRKRVLSNHLRNLNDFSLDDDITLVSLYEHKYSGERKISFDGSLNINSMLDNNSDCGIFFNNFINFRNNLISTGQVVKSDDIFQYYMSVTGDFSSNFDTLEVEKPKVMSKIRSFFAKK